MADFVKVNGVAASSIVKIDATAKSAIGKIDGCTTPSSGATYWVIALDDNETSWAAPADIADESVWAANLWDTATSGGSADTVDIAYGKDNSGNPIFVAISNTSGNNIWVDQNNDITDDSSWTRKSLPSTAHRHTIHWGDDVWIAAGNVSASNVSLHRSTDGAGSFAAVDVSGATNISTTEKITALSTDGAGNWMFGQKANLYFSSDDGASWAWLIQPSGTSGDFIRDIVYTNGCWVVLYSTSGNATLISCVGSTAANMDDSGDWGTAVTLTGSFTNSGGSTSTVTLSGTATKRMAAASGRIVALQLGAGHNDAARSIAADVSGKVITLDSSGTVQLVPFTQGTANCIATDGTTWLAGCDGGDTGRNGGELCRSTDAGDSWALIVDGIDNATSTRVNGIAPNVYLPL
tara:strand:+ start:38 stop:1258 length:1221 start_codon:yes stop_codon:yes gene_type:complete